MKLRDAITTCFDAAGVVLLAAGAGFTAAALVGPPGVAAAGVVLLAAVRLHDWIAGRGRSGGGSR